MKHITKKRLEKILISLIKKIDTQASNIRVVEEYLPSPNNRHINKIIVDYVYEDEFKDLNEYDKEWVSFGVQKDGNMFYDVDGVQGRHYFGNQDYSADLQIAWSFVQQELYKFGVHSESYYGQDGIHEVIGDGTFLNQKDLEENVFDRKPSEAVSKAYSEAFYRDFPEYREEKA